MNCDGDSNFTPVNIHTMYVVCFAQHYVKRTLNNGMFVLRRKCVL